MDVDRADEGPAVLGPDPRGAVRLDATDLGELVDSRAMSLSESALGYLSAVRSEKKKGEEGSPRPIRP